MDSPTRSSAQQHVCKRETENDTKGKTSSKHLPHATNNPTHTKQNKTTLPRQYHHIPRGAESSLVRWLRFSHTQPTNNVGSKQERANVYSYHYALYTNLLLLCYFSVPQQPELNDEQRFQIKETLRGLFEMTERCFEICATNFRLVNFTSFSSSFVCAPS